MTIEVDYNCRNLAIPQSNAAVIVPNRKDVGVCLALSERGDRMCAPVVLPAAQKLAFLYIPTQNFLVCGDDCLPCAGAIALLCSPDQVRGG